MHTERNSREVRPERHGCYTIELVYFSSRPRRDAADPITDRPSLAPINYSAAAAARPPLAPPDLSLSPSPFVILCFALL